MLDTKMLSDAVSQVSDKCTPEDLVSMISSFNPDNVPGRLGVVVRMGAPKLREKLPALIEAVRQSGQVNSPIELTGYVM